MRSRDKRGLYIGIIIYRYSRDGDGRAYKKMDTSHESCVAFVFERED